MAATAQISARDLCGGVGIVSAAAADAGRLSSLAVAPEGCNRYERRLLSDVIPPAQLGTCWDDVAALDDAKRALREAATLPLLRPELFSRGPLAAPCRGVLLYGPPGTGKTLLAKAVAHEAGASFLAAPLSSLSSKWLGDGVKLVRALFSLASKLSPCIVFVDEVDSVLGSRDRPDEHSAVRELKNEFMLHWDGLRTGACERVLVLAATNRPHDLDEAVLRRLPRRVLVPLPSAEAREAILRLQLADQPLAPSSSAGAAAAPSSEAGGSGSGGDSGAAFDFGELARKTDGYSGSDLKALCARAALAPVRELLRAEEEAAASASTSAGQASATSTTAIATKGGGGSAGPPHDAARPRPLALADFFCGKGDGAGELVMAPSVSATSLASAELERWHAEYGEGGKKKGQRLSYYT